MQLIIGPMTFWRKRSWGLLSNTSRLTRPNLNLIERLWKFFKKKVTKNTYYSTFDEFYQAVVNFFKHFDQYHGELASLLAPNFEIIKARLV